MLRFAAKSQEIYLAAWKAVNILKRIMLGLLGGPRVESRGEMRRLEPGPLATASPTTQVRQMPQLVHGTARAAAPATDVRQMPPSIKPAPVPATSSRETQRPTTRWTREYPQGNCPFIGIVGESFYEPHLWALKRRLRPDLKDFASCLARLSSPPR